MVQLTLPKNSKVSIGKTYKLEKKPSNQKVFKIYRFDPESGNLPSIDTYEVDLDTCGPMTEFSISTFSSIKHGGIMTELFCFNVLEIKGMLFS